MGKKGTSTREKNGKQMDLSICIFLAFILLSRFVFLLFVCFLPGKKQQQKQNKSKKTNRKSKINANGQVHVYPHFFPLFDFPLFFFPFFPLLFCFCVFGVLLICFLLFLFLLLSRFFSSFKQVRISYGLADIMLVYQRVDHLSAVIP